MDHKRIKIIGGLKMDLLLNIYAWGWLSFLILILLFIIYEIFIRRI